MRRSCLPPLPRDSAAMADVTRLPPAYFRDKFASDSGGDDDSAFDSDSSAFLSDDFPVFKCRQAGNVQAMTSYGWGREEPRCGAMLKPSAGGYPHTGDIKLCGRKQSDMKISISYKSDSKLRGSKYSDMKVSIPHANVITTRSEKRGFSRGKSQNAIAGDISMKQRLSSKNTESIPVLSESDSNDSSASRDQDRGIARMHCLSKSALQRNDNKVSNYEDFYRKSRIGIRKRVSIEPSILKHEWKRLGLRYGRKKDNAKRSTGSHYSQPMEEPQQNIHTSKEKTKKDNKKKRDKKGEKDASPQGSEISVGQLETPTVPEESEPKNPTSKENKKKDKTKKKEKKNEKNASLHGSEISLGEIENRTPLPYERGFTDLEADFSDDVEPRKPLILVVGTNSSESAQKRRTSTESTSKWPSTTESTSKQVLDIEPKSKSKRTNKEIEKKKKKSSTLKNDPSEDRRSKTQSYAEIQNTTKSREDTEKKKSKVPFSRAIRNCLIAFVLFYLQIKICGLICYILTSIVTRGYAEYEGKVNSCWWSRLNLL